ncbi:hypothetical protein EIP86_006060 [Pleurotus ostreatoroseus]|nr:hypothetical protein EIP86_006060 [Pleurotus ostreatoroseus]
MDNAPPEDPSIASGTDDFDSAQSLDLHCPETPTKKRVMRTPHDDATPRPNRQRQSQGLSISLETPRMLSQRSRVAQANGETDEASIRGYTLSHLRRVPELGLLARRVVEAEAKRRAREERKKQKEQAASKGKIKIQPSAAPKMSSTFKEVSGEPYRAKIKRLFTFAIRQLYDEGSIIIWDGPVRRPPLPPIPAPSFAAISQSQSQKNPLWRMSSTHSTTGDSSVLSSVSQLEDEDDDGNLSDPPPNEEAYIPLTPSYFATVVEKAIHDMIIARRRTQTSHLKSKSTSGPSALEIARSLRKHVDGPTPVEIAEFLKKRDERWRRVGEWAVKEALQWACQRGRVWDAGNGKWEISG